jgi:iron-sulfur cluster repair protein YtfE (RIC family)
MSSLEKLHTHHEKLITTIMSLAEQSKRVPSDTSLLLSYCNEYLVSHARAEETSLYAADDDSKFVNHMVQEHKEIKHNLDVIEAAFSRGEFQSLSSQIDGFTNLLKNHFDEEENVLMPKLDKKLSRQEFESLIEKTHLIETEKKESDIRSLFELDHKRIDLNISKLLDSKDEETIRSLYSKVRAELLKHIELEETLLFPTFGEHGDPGQMGPVQVMISEHREIVSHISAPPEIVDSTAIPAILQTLIGKLATHNKKEELILYPLINRTIPI